MTTNDKPVTDELNESADEAFANAVNDDDAGTLNGGDGEAESKRQFSITTPDGKTITPESIKEDAEHMGDQIVDALKNPGKQAIGDWLGMFAEGAKGFARGFLGERGPEKPNDSD